MLERIKHNAVIAIGILTNTIHLAMPVLELFGAGTCGKYLLREFSRTHTTYWDAVPGDKVLADPETKKLVEQHYRKLYSNIAIPLLQFTGPELEQQTRFRGRPNAGYIFSEWALITKKQKANLKAFDVLAAGSEWNAQVIRNAGFPCYAVPQGVDCEIFKPQERKTHLNHFLIYSGGQYAHRKAQDLVIRSVKVLQDRHPDILLVASWFNIWKNEDGYEAARKAGVRIAGLPLLDHESLALHMNQTDVGLFPNRCEGWTNLMLMDYLACGRPVVANTSTGQADVLHDSYSIGIRGTDDELVEQMIVGVEKLYANRGLLGEMGTKAANAMQAWPWSRTAEGLWYAIGETGIQRN